MLRGAGNNAIASDIMRLSCPECQTEYEVPDAALTGRPRKLRCASCGTTWKTPAVASEVIVVPEAAAAAAEAQTGLADAGWDSVPDPGADTVVVETPVAPKFEPQLSAARLRVIREAQVPPEPKPASNPGLRISVLVLVLLIVLVLAEHRAIIAAWPPSARLFDALGVR